KSRRNCALGDLDRTAHHVRSRAPVRDDGYSGDAQERRGYVRVVIHPAAELRDPTERDEASNFPERPAKNVAANAFDENVDHALHAFCEDVAGEAVGDADVGDPSRDITALDVAVEVQVLCAFEERVRGQLHPPALLRRLPGVDTANGRPIDALDLPQEASRSARKCK